MTSVDDAAPISINCGEDWAISLTYKRDGTPTAVSDMLAQIRSHIGGALVLDLTGYITQPAPGVLVLSVPHEVTASLTPGTYCWDLFASVAGRRRKLIPTSSVNIDGSVTSL